MTMFSIDDPRSYKTETGLHRAIKNIGADPELRYLVVCNRSGRFTAIFPTAWNPMPGTATGLAHRG